MESSGAFSQGDLGGEDDPFAGSEEEFERADAAAEEQAADAAREADDALEAERGVAATAELPVVDREGEPVEATTQVAPEASPEAGVVDPTPASEQPSETSAPAQVEQGSEPASGAAESSAAAGEPDPPAAATAGEPPAAAEAAGEPGGTEAPTSASSEAPGEAAGDASEAEEKDGVSDDPPPGVAEPPTEKGTKRLYKLFTPDGNGKFSEVSWYESKTGKVVEKGTSGAKKQTVVLARGQEDALRHGFAVLGQPQDGASLVAVAATYFQVKRVQPDEVQPIRQRLRIS